VSELTQPQRRLLRILEDHDEHQAMAGRGGSMSAREVARAMWPDSPGWERRSRRRATPASGALGATMPMKAGTMLWRLGERGLVAGERHMGSSVWWITAEGRNALARR
jgi:hypothetical protein